MSTDQTPSRPVVTVCIVAYNRREELGQTLRRMTTELDYPADSLEFIVVDNASADGTTEMLARDFPQVQVIANPENIGAPAWNHAFARGRGDYFLILDDDCYMRPDAMEIAVAAAEEAGADLISMGIASPEDENFRFDREYPTGLLSFWGCAALVSRRGIEATGGYDPNIFIWANEAEMTIRLLDRGLTHLFVPEAVAVHMKSPDSMRSYNAFGLKMNLRNFAYVSAKHLQARDAAGALGNLALRAVIEAVLRKEPLAYLPAVLEGARAGLRVRRPARPAVSRLYRREFMEFCSPLRFVRGPIARWRMRGTAGAPEAEIQRRRERFAAARPRLYPAQRSTLRV